MADWDRWYGWTPRLSVAARRYQAGRRAAQLAKKQGRTLSPVAIDGRKITQTFWGDAWCGNLERYSDFENRLPRGRSYVRSGSVIDLQIAPGRVTALVSGSELYDVEVDVSPVPKARWQAICRDSAGAIDSVVELLQGRLSHSVMTRLCREGTGLFPTPKEIRLSCSCPDWASMCKHVAAVLYGIGARLDREPALLFTLRKVKEDDLIARAGTGTRLAKGRPAASGTRKVLDEASLGAIFGLELAPPQKTRRAAQRSPRPRVVKRRAAAKSSRRRD